MHYKAKAHRTSRASTLKDWGIFVNQHCFVRCPQCPVSSHSAPLGEHWLSALVLRTQDGAWPGDPHTLGHASNSQLVPWFLGMHFT